VPAAGGAPPVVVGVSPGAGLPPVLRHDGSVEFSRPTLRREISVQGPRSVDDVWDRYVRPRRWPEWSPQIRSVDYPRERLAPGTVGVVHGPAGLPVRFRVIDVEESGPVRVWSWTVSAAGVRLSLLHTVEATAAGTRTGLTIGGFAPAVALYLPAAWWALRRLVH
jgi:hypothetical protein